MWFNNLKIYQFSTDFTLSNSELEEKLAEAVFNPCSNLQQRTQGWVSPIPQVGTTLTHSIQDKVLFCLQQEEKLLPASVVNELLNEEVLELEEKNGYKISRKQKMQMKEELIHTLLPRAFSKIKRFYAYIDRSNKIIIINSASSGKAEELTEFLRECVGSLAIVPLQAKQAAKVLMTQWITDQSNPNDFSLGHSCVLSDSNQEGGNIRCSKQELLSDEIKSLIQSGKEVTKLALTWSDKIDFVLNEDLSIKQIKFTDIIIEKHNTTHDDISAQFDEDFNLMSMEFALFIPRLMEVFSVEK